MFFFREKLTETIKLPLFCLISFLIIFFIYTFTNPIPTDSFISSVGTGAKILDLGDRNFYLEYDFIDYRGSLINWCPIGRSSSKIQRSKFVELDLEKNVRDHMINTLKPLLENNGFDAEKIQLSKGGQTSVDIFPIGWDKTFVFRHFSRQDCWFVGDACSPGQNDYELYKSLLHFNKSFKTESPSQTLEIIDKIHHGAKNET